MAVIDKKADFSLIGLGDPKSLLIGFRDQALREGWTVHEVAEVVREAQKGDHDHLVDTLAEHCIDPFGAADDEDDDDDEGGEVSSIF